MYHKLRSFRHNNNKYGNTANTNFLNENSKRISIPYENFDEIEDDIPVKKTSKPQYVDTDKLESIIDCEYGDNDHGGSDYEEEEEEDNDFQNEKIVAWTETIEYLQRRDNTLHPHHPDLYPGPLEVYTLFSNLWVKRNKCKRHSGI